MHHTDKNEDPSFNHLDLGMAVIHPLQVAPHDCRFPTPESNLQQSPAPKGSLPSLIQIHTWSVHPSCLHGPGRPAILQQLNVPGHLRRKPTTLATLFIVHDEGVKL